MQDKEALQALQQVFEQGLQIIQAMSSEDSEDSENPEEGMEDEDMEGDEDSESMDDMYNDDPYATKDDEGMDGEMPPDDQGMPPQGDEGDEYPDDDEEDEKPMGKRVADLENLTGFRKSARSGNLASRLENLEFSWFGRSRNGNMRSRIRTLEKEAGITANNEAPDVIHLDQLIKSAASQGAKTAIAQMQKSLNDEDLPDPKSLRKSARSQRTSKRVAPKSQSYEELAKSLGYEEDDLDRTIGFGDSLMAIYRAQQNGSILFEEDD